MPNFTILLTDQLYSSAEITADNPSAVFHIIERLDCKEADVLADDVYSFSIRLGNDGMWCIFRDDQQDWSAITAFG